jgi:cytochrome P450 PksS
MKPDFCLGTSESKANPYPHYARLRAESPVCEVRILGKQTAWLVTRYDDVLAVLKDERFAKDRFKTLTSGQLAKQPWMPSMFKPLARNMLDLDPPDHTRLRELVHKGFTPRFVEQLRGRIEALTQNLVDSLRGKQKFDLIADYALPVPATIIAEMLGVPAEDRERFHRWSSRLTTAAFSSLGMLLALPSAAAFLRYIRRLIQSRRKRPGEDLVSALVQVEETGEKLSEDELVAMIFLLLIAGHETTVNLIGNGTLALLEHPAQMEKLRKEPALIRTAVEELLRFEGPLETATERFASEDVSIAGVTIPQGALVYAGLASANRDERQFAEPDRLDITREPNPHLAFGLGIHYCLGAPLARLEGQIALLALINAFPNLKLRVPRERLEWRRGLVLRGLERLPVRCAS